MKVAIFGPICEDEITFKGKTYSQPGGVTYYTGNALSALGIDTTLFGTFGDEKEDFLKDFGCNIVHIRTENTIKFINEYLEQNSDVRIQRAEIHKNVVKVEHLSNYNLNNFDVIVLGPLFHDNFPKDTVRALSETNVPLFLSAQGMIRYLEGETIVWKNPSNVTSLLPSIDYLFLDEEELRFITGINDMEKSAQLLHDHGLKNLIITRGKEGSLIFIGDKKYRIEAFPPRKLVDPTGAGDSYLAGFVKSLELFSDPFKHGEMASMVATMAIETKGPFNKTTHEVIERLGWK